MDKFTLKDSFSFAKEIVEHGSSVYMGRLDGDSLFTNIPIEETILTYTLYRINLQTIWYCWRLNQSEFKKLLLSPTKEYYFNFNESLYKRIDGVEQWLEQCPDEFKPVYYRSNVDAIIVLFKSQDNRTKFRDYLNKCHPDM